MVLKKFSYSEFDGTWSLNDLNLEKINLLVGKNATGKTNTLDRIRCLAELISGRRTNLPISAVFSVVLSSDEGEYSYDLCIENGKVVNEMLSVGKDKKFRRNENGEGTIVATQFATELLEFKLDSKQLVVVTKRDAKQHPFLEKLFRWALGLRFYPFSSDMGQNAFYTTKFSDNIGLSFDPCDINSIVPIYCLGVAIPCEFKQRVIAAMGEVGYCLDDLSIAEDVIFKQDIAIPLPDSVSSNSSIPLDIGSLGRRKMLKIQEKGVNTPLSQVSLSRGMFRALSLVVHVTYNVMLNIATTILIDDIGEGLDFDRAVKVIKWLVRQTENSSIQLVMSTNNRFVMNNVPLEHWHIIQRNGGHCTVSDYSNAKDKFDEFKMMGLSNFDFLATDFLNATWDEI